MDMKAYIDEIKLKLGGDVLDLDIEDTTFEKIVNAAFREIQRYIDSTRLATLPYKPCIDLSDCHVSSVARVFRTQSYQNNSDTTNNSLMVDPMQAMQ